MYSSGVDTEASSYYVCWGLTSHNHIQVLGTPLPWEGEKLSTHGGVCIRGDRARFECTYTQSWCCPIPHLCRYTLNESGYVCSPVSSSPLEGGLHR